MADVLYGFDPSTVVTDKDGNAYAGRVASVHTTYVGGTLFTTTKAVVSATLLPGAATAGQVTSDGIGRAGFFATNDYTATLFLDFGDGTRWAVNPTKHSESGQASDRIPLARTPDALIAGTVTRNSNGAATAAPVIWPDGQPGTYTALVLSSAFPGAVDSYRITYGSPVTRTYTQPTITRDASGAATVVPAIVVT